MFEVCQSLSNKKLSKTPLNESLQLAEQKYRNHEVFSTKSSDLCNKINETIYENKRNVDQLIDNRIQEILERKLSIEEQRNQCFSGIHLLNASIREVEQFFNALQTSYQISKTCLDLRKSRLSEESNQDSVDVELCRETTLIRDVKTSLDDMTSDLCEQIRVIKSRIYHLNKDLEAKESSLTIEQNNKDLKETDFVYSKKDFSNFSWKISNITVSEWYNFTEKNLKSAKNELENSKRLIDDSNRYLREYLESLKDQSINVNEILKTKIQQTKDVKQTLEYQHKKVMNQISELIIKSDTIKKEMDDKSKFLLLAKTRLSNRHQRKDTELCYDNVEKSLFQEIDCIQQSVYKLQLLLDQTQKSIKSLLKIQHQLENDINDKLNSLQVDETECEFLRTKIDYNCITLRKFS